MASLPPENTFPLCTIKETPRLPEHCIQYAFMIEWNNHFTTKKMDKDSPEDMMWVCEKAQERANTYGIEGVDYKLTMGVVKNIIPAVASTNALVSAACINEAFKILTGCNSKLNNYMQYMGQTNVSVSAFEYQREPGCLICSQTKAEYTVSDMRTLKSFVDKLITEMKLNGPTISGKKGILVGRGALAEMAAFKLEMNFRQLLEQHLIENGEEFELTDKTLPGYIALKIYISEEEMT